MHEKIEKYLNDEIDVEELLEAFGEFELANKAKNIGGPFRVKLPSGESFVAHKVSVRDNNAVVLDSNLHGFDEGQVFHFSNLPPATKVEPVNL